MSETVVMKYQLEGSMRRISCTAAAIVFSLPVSAMAINIFSAKDMPVRYMTDEDREILKAAAEDVLERNKDGAGTHWENPKTGAHGDLTPRVSFERDGQPCRDLEVANSARGRDNRIILTLCKQADGDWKIDPR